MYKYLRYGSICDLCVSDVCVRVCMSKYDMGCVLCICIWCVCLLSDVCVDLRDIMVQHREKRMCGLSDVISMSHPDTKPASQYH